MTLSLLEVHPLTNWSVRLENCAMVVNNAAIRVQAGCDETDNDIPDAIQSYSSLTN